MQIGGDSVNKDFIYQPHRTQKYMSVFIAMQGIFLFVIAGAAIRDIGIATVFFIGIGFVAMYLAKELYDSSKITVFVCEDGLRIAGCKHESKYFPWDVFSYTYYAKNFKGFLFLVLSPDPLSTKAAKKLANRAANICIGSAVAIHIDALQDTSQFEKMIREHIKDK